jgi:hypothetical protein
MSWPKVINNYSIDLILVIMKEKSHFFDDLGHWILCQVTIILDDNNH